MPSPTPVRRPPNRRSSRHSGDGGSRSAYAASGRGGNLTFSSLCGHSDTDPGIHREYRSGNWPTYSPGQMPRGRLSNIPDMGDLAGRGLAGERIYLQGNFVVTAAGQNRAVLRANNGLSETLGIGGKTANTRIIVEYPSGTKPPTEGATFSRDSRRPFLITDVKKGADGQVNVYVREITRGQ